MILKQRRRVVILAAMTAIVASAALLLPHRTGHRYTDFAGTPVIPQRVAEDFVLPTGAGGERHLIDGTAAATYLFFGYAHCRDVCPIALGSLGRAYRTLPPSAAARVRIAFVTVDPARDTPSVAAAYARRFDPHIVAYGGSRATLERVWRAYGVQVDAKSGDVAHGDTIDAIDADGHVVLQYPPDTAAQQIAADMVRFTH